MLINSRINSLERAADILADRIKDVADGIGFVLGIAACFVAPGVANVLLSYGMDTVTAAFCYAIGDDEEAQQRVIGMAISGAIDGVVGARGVCDDILETAYGTGIKSIDFDDGFKGFDLDTNNGFFKNADDVADLTDDTFGSVYKKKIASESSEYVDDIVRNTDVKQPKNTSSVGNVSSTGTLDEGLNFSNRAFKHMGEKGREVPIQTLQDAIRYGNAMPDPRGSSATMYYITMHKNGKMYNLEVLYDEVTNTIYHFKYARKAMGNLPAISK